MQYYNMSVQDIITSEIKAENRIEFDRITTLLLGIGSVIAKIRSEIIAIQSKFISMIEILKLYPDQISLLEKQLYDIQCQAFLHAVSMYLGFRDTHGELFINPYDPDSPTTDITITVKFPHYTINQVIAKIDNISVDLTEWDVYMGTQILNALKSDEIVQQFSVVAEEPTPYFSKDEFLSGISYEIEKLMLFNSNICRLEQHVNSGIKYISELKNIGLYN